MMRLKIGLPVGSMNTPGRADTRGLLIAAGYPIEGYDHGRETEMSLRMDLKRLEPHLVRPQSLPIELSMGLLDAGIGGEDWFAEEIESGNCPGLTKIGDLDYGHSRLVVAIAREHPADDLEAFIEERAQKGIVCFTEYPYLMRAAFVKAPAYGRSFGASAPQVQIRGAREGKNPLVRIVNSEGLTEAHMRKGADMIMDHTRSGRTLAAFGLKEIAELMTSSAVFYAGPSCGRDKLAIARDLYDRLSEAARCARSR